MVMIHSGRRCLHPSPLWSKSVNKALNENYFEIKTKKTTQQLFKIHLKRLQHNKHFEWMFGNRMITDKFSTSLLHWLSGGNVVELSYVACKFCNLQITQRIVLHQLTGHRLRSNRDQLRQQLPNSTIFSFIHIKEQLLMLLYFSMQIRANDPPTPTRETIWKQRKFNF